MENTKNDSGTFIYRPENNDMLIQNNACLVIIKAKDEDNIKFDLYTDKESSETINNIKKTFRLGRDAGTNDIIIDDKIVSRQHAVILQDGKNFYIKDNNSTNGTYVNNIKISDLTRLKNQDKIKIGNIFIKFLQGDVEALFYDNLRKKIDYDGLTKIYNRNFFDINFNKIFLLTKRHKNFLSLILFDIDDFKKINDTYGHPAGDFILAELSNIINGKLRETDLFARVGGEEFAIICQETDIDSANKLAKRILETIRKSEFVYNKQIIAVTISIGIAEFNSSILKEADLFNLADKALYNAKTNGKNQVVLYRDIL